MYKDEKKYINIDFTKDELKSLITVLKNSKRMLDAAVIYGKANDEETDNIDNLQLQSNVCELFIETFTEHIDIGEPINKIMQ